MEQEKIKNETSATNGIKKPFAVSVVCIIKNQQQNAGSVIFGFNVSTNQQGQQTAEKSFEYKTTDQQEIDNFKIGSYYTITVT